MAIRLSDQTSSFMLLRTNPRLSGNIKITVDSTGGLWLNSIDANDALSDIKYKKYRVAVDGTYDKDLRDLFGDVAPDVLFERKEHRSLDNTAVEYSEQYNFDYSAGAYPLVSKLYSEDYAYMAPLWIRERLPDFFVIFRIDEPTDYPYNEDVPSGSIDGVTPRAYKLVPDEPGVDFSVVYAGVTYHAGDTFVSQTMQVTYTRTGNGRVVLLDENKDIAYSAPENFTDLMSRSVAVKTFDLTEKSEVGLYLRRMLSDPRFPASPMTVSYESDQLTTWNGYAYSEGILSSRGENLSSFWSSGTTQMDLEEYVTDGFARNGIICPNLLNLEFLFEDPNTPLYSIPRYFGFYVSANELGSFELSGSLLSTNGAAKGNTPQPKHRQGYKTWTKNFFQQNPAGVTLFFENATGTIPTAETFQIESDRLFYVLDKKRQLHSINQKPEKYGAYGATNDIMLRDTSINLTDFGGVGDPILYGKGSKLSSPGKAFVYITVKGQFELNDTIRLYTPSGLKVDAFGRYDEIIANDLRRAFTSVNVSPQGTVISLAGDMTPYYSAGQSVQIQYGQNVFVDRTISVVFYNGTDTEISLQTPLPATVTSGFVMIVRDWGPGSHLASDDFTTVYFHPYGTTQQVAAAISAAFKSIESRRYTSVSVKSDVVLALMSPGKQGNESSLRATLFSYSSMTVNGEAVGSGFVANFGGGTDIARTRLKLKLNDADKLKQSGEVYVGTLGGVSKVAWIGRYIDSPVSEVGGSDIGSYKEWETSASLYIEDASDETQVGNTGIFVASKIFRPKVGVLGVFPIREFDSDFYSSTYGRSPDAELRRYYDIQPDAEVVVPNRGYVVKGDPSVDSVLYDGNVYYPGDTFIGVSGVPAFTINSGRPFVVQRLFCRKNVLPLENLEGTALAPVNYYVDGEPSSSITYYSPMSGPTVVFQGTTFASDGGYYDTTGDPVVYKVDQSATNSDMDPDLKSFPGFFKLKDLMAVYDTVSQQETAQYQLNDKFKYLDILSEYDFLKENFLKSNAIKSRLSPTIVKWSYAGGRDSRDNPYRLNTSQVFGTYNFSPSLQIRTQNPQAMTHEWYYLESKPLDFPEPAASENYYFFDDPLDMSSLVDANPSLSDYFLSYFTYAPSNSAPYQERFSIFRKDAGVTTTMFRGMRMVVRDVISGAPITPSGKPQYKVDSDRFVGYKFSAILRVVKEDPNVIQAPVTISFHNNETTKSIVCVIDVVTDDYRSLKISDPSGMTPNVVAGTTLPTTNGYNVVVADGVDLTPYVGQYIKFEAPYEFYAKIVSATYAAPNTTLVINPPYPVTTASATWTIGDQYPQNLDRSIDYMTLYSAKSKRTESTFFDYGSLMTAGTDSFRPGDVKLSVALDLSYPSAILGLETKIFGIDNPLYDWDLRDEIRNFQTYNTFSGRYFYGVTAYPYPLSAGQTYIGFGIPGGISPSYQFEAPVGVPVSIPNASDFEWAGFPQVQRLGGLGYMEPIMQRLSAAAIADKLNRYSPVVRYTSYYWDEPTNSTKTRTGDYYIEVLNPSVIQKTSALIPSVDTDKPDELATEQVIGASVESVPVSAMLARYAGPHEPMFRDIIFFEKKDPGVYGSSADLQFANAKFRTSVSGFALSKNLAYVKVSVSDILALAGNQSYKPLYPYIGECSIDYRDHYVFKSSWDPGYFRLYSTPTSFESKAGTRNMLEQRNMFGTKLMKTQDEVQLMTWSVEKVDNIDLVNPDTMTQELVWSETETQIVGFVNSAPRLRRFFVETGASTEFRKYVLPDFGVGDPDSIDDDVSEYLTLNVLPRYEAADIQPYLRTRSDNSDLNTVDGVLNDTQKTAAGFVKSQGFTVTKAGTSKFVYKFVYAKNPNFFVDIAFSVKASRI